MNFNKTLFRSLKDIQFKSCFVKLLMFIVTMFNLCIYTDYIHIMAILTYRRACDFYLLSFFLSDTPFE